MANIFRTFARKARGRLLADTITSIRQLDADMKSLHHDQLQINHNQIGMLKELDKITKNSGNIYLSPSEIVTKIFSGLKVYVDPQDLTGGIHLALDSIWEHNISNAWLYVVKPNDTVVDIGANFGYFGALAAQKTSKHAKIFLFEANPYLIPYIRKTLIANWLIDKCKVENLAVSDKDGEVTLSFSQHFLGNASLDTTSAPENYDDYKVLGEKL